MVLLIWRLKQNICLWCPHVLQWLIDGIPQAEICLSTWQISVLCDLVISLPLEAEGRRDSKASCWWCKGGTRAIELARSDGKRNIYGPKEYWVSVLTGSSKPAVLGFYGRIQFNLKILQHSWAKTVFLWFVVVGSALCVTTHQRDTCAWWYSSVLALCCDQSPLGCQWCDRALSLWLWSLTKLFFFWSKS